MSINSTLKKEGIKVIGQLNTLEINKIASSISEKISKAFPEHNLNQSDLFISIARLNMYIAEMPDSMVMAKYFYKNNSIYFSKDMDLDNINALALHECLHFIQTLKNKHGKLLRLGLYNLEGSNNSGMGLNEAAVQQMASIASDAKLDTVKYYGMDFSTESPDFYPLQTTLIKELAYFTGTYPLFHSTLFSNDVFKNTFIAKFNKRIYNRITRQLDKLLNLEAELTCYINELGETENLNDVKELNSIISEQKQKISNLFFNIQNFIIRNCFSCEFNHINTMEDLKEIKHKLYTFKNIIGTTEGYNFYNNFYCDLMNALEQKKEEILKYGEISLFKQECTALTLVDQTKEKFNFVHIFIKKLKKLFRLNRGTINDYDN